MEHTKKRASAEQFETMLVALERSPLMLTVRSGNNTQYGELWQALTERLNDMGIAKTAAKWQQAWRDWKSNTKKKAAKILEEKGKNGDGKAALQPLTDLEVRVLNLVGTDLVDFAKPPEIDISSIAELDPLSSEEASRDSGSDGVVFAADTVTVYAATGAPGAAGEPRVKTERESPPRRRTRTNHHSGKSKRHRIDFSQTAFGTERLRRETTEVLQRLTALERSRQGSEEKWSAALERLARALEGNATAMTRQAIAAAEQARALDRLTAAVEARLLHSAGNPP